MSRVKLPRTVITTLVAFTVGAALLVPATAATAAGGGGGALAGTWTSMDADGSHQSLDITGSGNRVYSMVYIDDSATDACGGDPARLSGPGFVDGDSVLMVAALVCLPGGNDFRERLTVGFQYDSENDILIDDFDIVWSRVG